MTTFRMHWQRGGAAEIAWTPRRRGRNVPQAIAIAHERVAFSSSGEEHVARNACDVYVIRVGALVDASVGVDKRALRTMV